MIALAPGSLPWLLKHEMKLAFRTRKTGPWTWALLIVGLLFMQGIGVVSALGFARMKTNPVVAEVIIGGVGVFSMAIMLAAAMQLTVQTIYTRGDLDLLLSSPLRPRIILPIRLLAIALSITSGSLLLAGCFMNGGAIIISARWLVGYLTLPALSMVSVTLSFLMVLGLVRLIGPRRARTATQVIGGIIGIGAAVAAQIPNMQHWSGNGSQRRNVIDALAGLADSPVADPLRWLGSALIGNPVPTALLLLVGFGGFALATGLLGQRFVQSVNAAAGTDASPKRRTNADGALAMHVRGVTGSILWKEWRLLLRDPGLLTQVVTIALVALPIVLPTIGQHMETAGGESLPVGWLGMVPVAGLLAGALVWLAFAGEDAPDLLGTAPVSTRRLVADRLLAASLPSILLVTGLCLYLAVRLPLAALELWLVSLLSTQLYLALNMRLDAPPGGRKAFQKRYQGNILPLLGEMLLGFVLFGLAWVTLVYLPPGWSLSLLLALNGAGIAGLLFQGRPDRP